ncbi:MAG: glycosyltransferase family 2 protein [Candidatus Omnitrophota bacterium]
MFSVIIPTYNRCQRLRKAVDSVLTQTWDDWELIIVDDGSTDMTADMLAEYADPRIRYVRQENQGPSAARNHGLRLARREWVAFLDSDDWWLPQKLARVREEIGRFPDIPIFHTEEIWYRRGQVLPQKKHHRKPEGRVYQQALPLCCISISTAVVRRTVFMSAGGFDEGLPACEDYDLWLRLTARYPVKLISEALTEKDGGRDDELSVRVWGLDRFRVQALTKMLEQEGLAEDDRRATVNVLEEKCRIFAKGARKRGRDEEARHYEAIAQKYSWTSGEKKPQQIIGEDIDRSRGRPQNKHAGW